MNPQQKADLLRQLLHALATTCKHGRLLMRLYQAGHLDDVAEAPLLLPAIRVNARTVREDLGALIGMLPDDARAPRRGGHEQERGMNRR